MSEIRKELKEALTKAWPTGTPPHETIDLYVDAIAPVVERIANRCAADELWAAAEEPWDDLPMTEPLEQLADRARIRARLGRRAAVKQRAAEELLAASKQAMQGPPWIRGDHTTDRPGYNFDAPRAEDGS